MKQPMQSSLRQPVNLLAPLEHGMAFVETVVTRRGTGFIAAGNGSAFRRPRP